MEISINAPSYKRSDDVRTLGYLPMCRVWVDCKEYEEYKKNYPDCLETNSKNNTAIISTTLHIASGRIMFSIHPARVVIGTVECFYNMTEEDKAVAFSSAGI